MASVRNIYIARHGNRVDFVDPDWSRTAKRPHDPHLSPDGVEQAKRLGRRLLKESVDHIFSSPFLRAVETAHYISSELKLPVKIEHGLSEWLNDEWFAERPICLSSLSLARTFQCVDTTYSSLVSPRYPETWDDALVRAAITARLLAERYPGNLLFVGHGHSVLGATQGLVGENIDLNCELCCLVKVAARPGGQWMLELAGDTSHLAPSLDESI